MLRQTSEIHTEPILSRSLPEGSRHLFCQENVQQRTEAPMSFTWNPHYDERFEQLEQDVVFLEDLVEFAQEQSRVITDGGRRTLEEEVASCLPRLANLRLQMHHAGNALTQAAAEDYLLPAVHQSHDLTSELNSLSQEDHIRAATPRGYPGAQIQQDGILSGTWYMQKEENQQALAAQEVPAPAAGTWYLLAAAGEAAPAPAAAAEEAPTRAAEVAQSPTPAAKEAWVPAAGAPPAEDDVEVDIIDFVVPEVGRTPRKGSGLRRSSSMPPPGRSSSQPPPGRSIYAGILDRTRTSLERSRANRAENQSRARESRMMPCMKNLASKRTARGKDTTAAKEIAGSKGVEPTAIQTANVLGCKGVESTATPTTTQIKTQRPSRKPNTARQSHQSQLLDKHSNKATTASTAARQHTPTAAARQHTPTATRQPQQPQSTHNNDCKNSRATTPKPARQALRQANSHPNKHQATTPMATQRPSQQSPNKAHHNYPNAGETNLASVDRAPGAGNEVPLKAHSAQSARKIALAQPHNPSMKKLKKRQKTQLPHQEPKQAIASVNRDVLHSNKQDSWTSPVCTLETKSVMLGLEGAKLGPDPDCAIQ